jgi:hypothetical protein
MKKIVVVALLLMGLSGMALALTAVPEIDPSMGGTALTLLGGAILVFRSRNR